MGHSEQGVTEEQMLEFFRYLTDKMGMEPKHAFDIIYYLQETMGILPDSWELCARCGNIFDSNREGSYVDEDFEIDWQGDDLLKPLPQYIGNHYCEWCIMEIEGE